MNHISPAPCSLPVALESLELARPLPFQPLQKDGCVIVLDICLNRPWVQLCLIGVPVFTVSTSQPDPRPPFEFICADPIRKFACWTEAIHIHFGSQIDCVSGRSRQRHYFLLVNAITWVFKCTSAMFGTFKALAYTLSEVCTQEWRIQVQLGDM